MHALVMMPILGYEIRNTRYGDVEQEFSCGDFDSADKRLNDLREQNPNKEYDLVAIIDA